MTTTDSPLVYSAKAPNLQYGSSILVSIFCLINGRAAAAAVIARGSDVLGER